LTSPAGRASNGLNNLQRPWRRGQRAHCGDRITGPAGAWQAQEGRALPWVRYPPRHGSAPAPGAGGYVVLEVQAGGGCLAVDRVGGACRIGRVTPKDLSYDRKTDRKARTAKTKSERRHNLRTGRSTRFLFWKAPWIK